MRLKEVVMDNKVVRDENPSERSKNKQQYEEVYHLQEMEDRTNTTWEALSRGSRLDTTMADLDQERN